MSLLQKDEIMEIIQKGNSKNILRRIIKSKNHHKFTDTKEIKRRKKQQIGRSRKTEKRRRNKGTEIQERKGSIRKKEK